MLSFAVRLSSLRLLAGFALFTLTAFILLGCATSGSKMSPEQLAGMATIECADFYTLRSVDSGTIGLFQRTVNVPAGMHTIEMEANCHYNNCPTQTFRFYTKPGYIYRILPNNTIAVLDRSDRYQRKVDELNPVSRGGIIEYVNRDGQTDYARDVALQAQAERAAVLERRKLQLPIVRKVGAKVCQLKGQLLYIGFVESFTDDKIQIRTVDAVVNENHNAHLTSFRPSIIWDSPLNWDLCE